jgi:hypothetical protein
MGFVYFAAESSHRQVLSWLSPGFQKYEIYALNIRNLATFMRTGKRRDATIKTCLMILQQRLSSISIPEDAAEDSPCRYLILWHLMIVSHIRMNLIFHQVQLRNFQIIYCFWLNTLLKLWMYQRRGRPWGIVSWREDDIGVSWWEDDSGHHENMIMGSRWTRIEYLIKMTA